MPIGCLQVKLSIPDANNLKEKRMVLRSLKDRMRNTMNVSIAELDHQDVWKSAVIGVVTIAAEKVVVERRLSDAAEFIRCTPEVILMEVMTEII
jgi:uncharacterized protein